MNMIALVGLPGSGKSTISRQLGRLLQCPVLDTDAVIEEYIGCSIAYYFEREGEAAFRDLESKTLAETLELRGRSAVIATGGGIVLRAENRAVLRSNAYTVYLHAEPEQLLARLKNDRSRPLLQNTHLPDKLRSLYAQRHKLYQEVAQCQVDAIHYSPQTVAEQILVRYQTTKQSQ
ncbi:MAG: shikimate kinase [Brachymonas sp.]|jgi:shikimate kinase